MTDFVIPAQFTVANIEISAGTVVVGPGGNTFVAVTTDNGTLHNTDVTPTIWDRNADNTRLGHSVPGTVGASVSIPHFDLHPNKPLPARLFFTIDDGTGTPVQWTSTVIYAYQAASPQVG